LFDREYKILLIFFFVSLLISTALVLLSFLLGPKAPDREKTSSYECGFEPFTDARIKFDIHFYLVAILFIIFDLEIVFLFPWCSAIPLIYPQGFWAMILFLFILTVGFFYEWRKGALNWK